MERTQKINPVRNKISKISANGREYWISNGVKSIIFFAFAAVFFITLPTIASAATLYFSPSSGDYSQNENFTVSVLVDSKESINAAGGMITFPTEYLEVIAVSTVNSILSLWVKNPSFSNTANMGNVRFEGIVLNPGYAGSRGKVIDIVFRIKKSGSASLAFQESSILANDGKGTNILSSVGTAAFTLTNLRPSAKSKETNSILVLEEKIDEIAEKLKSVTEPSQQAPIVVIQKHEPPSGVLGFWEILPRWIRISILFSLGIVTIIVAFAVLSFAAIFLIWIAGYLVHKGIQLKNILIVYWKGAKKELKGDVNYSIYELNKEIQRAAWVAPSFQDLMTHYWLMIGRIIKRFFTKNEDNTIENSDRNGNLDDAEKFARKEIEDTEKKKNNSKLY